MNSQKMELRKFHYYTIKNDKIVNKFNKKARHALEAINCSRKKLKTK